MASTQQVKRIATQDARRVGFDVATFLKQLNLESGFRQSARSPAGAIGVGQLMPGTARGLGVNPYDLRQNIDGAARYDAQQLKRFGGDYRKALAAYNAGPGNIAAGLGYADRILQGRTPSSTAPRGGGAPGPGTRTIPGVDRSSDRLALLQNYLLNQSSHDTQSTGLLDTLQQIRALKDTPARTVRLGASQRVSGPPAGGGGVQTFDGKPVQGWIVPILRRAKAAGWTGTVTSGVRTPQQQLAAAQRFGLSHYGPKGPLGSNHLAGRGAVDVTNPDQLAQVLKKLGITRLKRSMANDPVHFSATGY